MTDAQRFSPDPLNEATRPTFEIFHLDDLPWSQAPLPRRLHRCRVQTRGWDHFRLIERCACGAIRLDGRGWLDRNSRRKHR